MLINKKKTENRDWKTCSFCGKTFPNGFTRDRHTESVHGTASSNESFMEDQEQEIPEGEYQEELEVMAPIFIPEQEMKASTDSVNEDLAHLRVNEMPSHIEDQPQPSSSETSTTVSTGIETTHVSNGFELPIITNIIYAWCVLI